MTREELLAILQACPLVASVQASEGSPLEDPGTLARMALASAGEGVGLLRVQGLENISAVREGTALPCIGLIKRHYEDSIVYITPTLVEVDALLHAGVEIVALDATARPRPGDAWLHELVARIHEAGRLAMGDCDTLESILHALDAGCDVVGTTLSGYTSSSPARLGPDLELVRSAAAVGVPVLAEGRFGEPWHAAAALRAGAIGVVVGGALNDPVKQTRAFLAVCKSVEGPIGAVDLGGTWLRYGVFDARWKLLDTERTPTPASPDERLGWIRSRIRESGVRRVGVGAGGVIDPRTGEVWRSKPLIPEHEGTVFAFDVPTLALNDGLATAWGHACHPRFAGTRVATIALGTGVGFGIVDHGRPLMGPRGEPSHLNDVPTPWGSFEELLGGHALSAEPNPAQVAAAREAGVAAIHLVRALFHPEHIVVCGGVGLALLGSGIRDRGSGSRDQGSEGGRSEPPRTSGGEGAGGEGSLSGATPSPFGEDAGLYGAAALALYPPELP